MKANVRILLPLVLSFLPVGSLWSQTAPSSNSPASDSSFEVTRLSPFAVTPDSSWAATTTLSGNRTRQEIEKLPATIEVITSDFIKDLNLGSLEDAASFVSGLTVQPRLESRNDEGRISYRGLTGAANTSRNFFMWYVPSDTYNVERFDFSLGSNSLMFGDAAPGGQATVYTKRPRFSNFGEASASFSSFDTSRFQLDLNASLGKKFAIRVNAVNRVDSSYIHHTYQRQKAADLALLFQPFKNTTILIEGERGKQVRRRGDNAVAILDTAASGRAYNQNNRWFYTSDGTIISRPSSPAIATVDTTGASGNTISLLSGQSVDVTLPGGVKKTFYGYSRNFDVLGPLDYLDRPYNVFQATLDQSIGKLELEFSYNQQFQHQNRNDNSFGTTQSPPTISVDGSGRPFLDMTGTAQYKNFGNIVKAGRVSAAYPFTFGKWMKQYVVISALRQKDFGHNRRYLLANMAGNPSLTGTTNTLQNNIITMRAYLDDPRIDTNGYWAQFELQNMPRTATFQPAIFETYANTAPFIDIRYQRNVSASASGEYLGGRLTSLFGVTFSRVSRKIPALSNYTLDAQGFIRDPGLPEENPSAFVYDAGYDLGARSTTAGLSYQLIKSESANVYVYGVYSQSFNWQSGTTFSGQVLGPILGATHEAGLKGNLFNRALTFQLAGYNIKRQNVAYVWGNDIISAIQLEDLINPNNLTIGSPGYLPVTTSIVGSERRTVNSHEESHGFDFTLQAKRTYGLQARVTASVVHVESTPDFAAFKAFLDAAIKRTAAANAPGGDPTMAESATNITNATTIYNNSTTTTRVTGLRSAPYTTSVVLDYEIPKLRGLRAGLTAVMTPNYNIAIFNGVAYRSGARLPLGAYLLYDRKIAKQNFTFRVGAQNFWDPVNGDSRYRKTGANLNTATQTIYYIYRYTDPVVYSGSITARF